MTKCAGCVHLMNYPSTIDSGPEYCAVGMFDKDSDEFYEMDRFVNLDLICLGYEEVGSDTAN